jgi:hypothetical protein
MNIQSILIEFDKEMRRKAGFDVDLIIDKVGLLKKTAMYW